MILSGSFVRTRAAENQAASPMHDACYVASCQVLVVNYCFHLDALAALTSLLESFVDCLEQEALGPGIHIMPAVQR